MGYLFILKMKYKIIGIVIILIGIFILISQNIENLYETKTKFNVVNTMEYKNINNEHVGYIEIPRINIKKEIKYGSSKNILDENYVGILNGKTLENNNIVLAGHNIKTVFYKIRKLKKDDIAILNTNKNKKYYKVKDIRVINKNEFKYFYDTEKKLLTLVTCTNNNNKRLLVICELYDEKVL